MKTRDLVSSVACMVLGGLFVAGALQLGLIRRGVPGPGFIPFFTGLALIVVSLFVFIPAIGQREKATSDAFFPERDSLRKLLLALVALVGFGVVMEYAGYLLTTFAFMFLINQIMEPKRWRAVTVLALLTAVVSYLLFVVLLEVNLPKGFLSL